MGVLTVSGLNAAIANVFVNPDGASIKKLAWAYGCAKRGSDEERQLLELLVARVRKLEQLP